VSQPAVLMQITRLRGPLPVAPAIERAPKTTAGCEIRRVTCTLAEAKDMLEYFERAASHLQVRGEYEKSTACTQALESIRRALQH